MTSPLDSLRPLWGATTALACAALLFTPAPAHAYEHTLTLDVGAGYGLRIGTAPNHGATVWAGASVGLSDALSARLVVSNTFLPGSPDTDQLLFGAEVFYLLDVLELVPFFGAGIDGVVTFTGAIQPDFAAHAVVGVDWLLSREVVLGLDIRPYVVATNLAQVPALVHVTLRASFLFEL